MQTKPIKRKLFWEQIWKKCASLQTWKKVTERNHCMNVTYEIGNMYCVSIKLIETQVEVWENKKCCTEHELQASVSTAFSSCPKLLRVFL